ncbi:MAG: SpoIIE family protein phosphatase [Bdellovibrionota bacterium]
MSESTGQLHLDEQPEKILIIASNRDAAAKLGRVLESRGFTYQFAPTVDDAVQLAATELFDLVIAEYPDNSVLVIDAINAIANESDLRRSPLLLLHPNASSVSEEQRMSYPFRVQLLPVPWERGTVLVKASAELRLQKLRSEEGRFLSGITGQNLELRDLTNRFMRELREAQAIQSSLMPTELPSAPGTRFAAAYVPLDVVGGDIYDIWSISPELHGLFIGDVTGHGLSAALIGAMTKMAMSYAPKLSPEDMLREMNNGLAPLMPEGRFVTAELAFYNSDTGTLMLARGGHPPAFLYRAQTGAVEELAPRGFALGMIANAKYELLATKLEPGDKLLMLTDGMTESSDMQGKLLGTSGVSEIFGRLAPSYPIDRCIGELLDIREEYSRGRVVKDDIAVIGLERIGEPTAS